MPLLDVLSHFNGKDLLLLVCVVFIFIAIIDGTTGRH